MRLGLIVMRWSVVPAGSHNLTTFFISTQTLIIMPLIKLLKYFDIRK